MMKNLARRARLALIASLACVASPARAAGTGNAPAERVILISVDGMHAFDLAKYAAANPDSTFSALLKDGVNYTSASAAKPADSFPGGAALFTGGSSAVTGIYFDLSYDRALWPPGVTDGPTGTQVSFDESVDINPNALDGGGGIDPNRLPTDPARDGAPVYPHNYLRVNTIFEVVKAAGKRTAWIDKHLADEIAHGPSGQGVDDLYTPEIAARNANGISFTKSTEATKAYDDGKVDSLIHQIKGFDHTGAKSVGVPALFGMNFQAVSVAQKLRTNRSATGTSLNGPEGGPGGYLDGLGTPSYLVADALSFVDSELGRIVTTLREQGLLDTTYIVITSKHGQAPVDPTKLNVVSPSIIPGIVDQVTPVARVTADDSALIWLQDQTQTDAAVAALMASQDEAFIQDIWSGETLKLRYADPLTDSRAPDIIAVSKPGTVYSSSQSKIAEHGGFSDQDLNVPLVVSNPNLKPQTVRITVQTSQVAPTVLQLLGLDPFALEAVQAEKTPVLPGFEAAAASVVSPFTAKLGGPQPSVVQLQGGQAQFQIQALQTLRFAVEASTDLKNWSVIGTNSFVASGSTTATDTKAANFQKRFYRATALPD